MKMEMELNMELDMTGKHLNYDFEILKEKEGFYYKLHKDVSLPIYDVRSMYSHETKELARRVAISHINLIVNGRI